VNNNQKHEIIIYIGGLDKQERAIKMYEMVSLPTVFGGSPPDIVGGALSPESHFIKLTDLVK
jgi:hypothetical protein